MDEVIVLDLANEDTESRLEKVKNAYEKNGSIIRKIVDKFASNNFQPLTTEELKQVSSTRSICMKHYTRWNDKRYQYKVLERVGKNKWRLRPCISELALATAY